MMNRVILMGRMTRDPEFRQTTSGVPVCRFSLAINRQFANKQTGERETDFVDCDAWRSTAEFISRYFSKGSMILVEGQLRNNNYEDNNGVKHYLMRVLVDSVSFCGSKDGDSGQQQSATQQAAAYYQQAAPDQRAAAPTSAPVQQLSLDDLGEFEEILSDGEVPF